jgi:glycosyltransferase involved in cell wall biosynthesis
VLEALPRELPVFVVDDGSDVANKALIAAATNGKPNVTVLTRRVNGGKGAAFKTGLTASVRGGFTHALQVDADGQHDVSRAADFFHEAAQHPDTLIAGLPVFDATAPLVRLRGRRVATAWASIAALERFPDVLCGFRVYPVAATWALERQVAIDARMGFDAEILVRLRWAGTPVVFLPVAVHYPEGGLSHFRYGRDNLRMSWMFARLVVGMLLRLPWLIARKRRGRK